MQVEENTSKRRVNPGLPELFESLTDTFVGSEGREERTAPDPISWNWSLTTKGRKQVKAIRSAIKQVNQEKRSQDVSVIVNGLKKRALANVKSHTPRPVETGDLVLQQSDHRKPVGVGIYPRGSRNLNSKSSHDICNLSSGNLSSPPETIERIQYQDNAWQSAGDSTANEIDQKDLTGGGEDIQETKSTGSVRKIAETTYISPMKGRKRSRPQEGEESADSNAFDHNMEDSNNSSGRKIQPLPSFPLTEECHHYTHISEVPWDIQKYWHQRHKIFSCYDDGIYMTDETWFGVTPEPVAIKVESDLAKFASSEKTVIIDMFAGAGGNAISFAISSRWHTIIAIEKDPSVIACAQHNADIYGVSNQIYWINDDCFSYLAKNLATKEIDPTRTVIFASPPWGGPGYTSDKVFNLSTMHPYPLSKIHDSCKEMDCALYLPRTSDLRQIAKLAPEGKKVEVVQYCMDGASKALVAYIPGCPIATT